MNKILILAFVAVTFVAINEAMPSDGVELKVRGGVRKLEGDDIADAVQTLELSLKKLAEGEDGPHYKLGKVHSATKQLVSGSLYKINADIIDNDEKTKTCNIKIWSQPWLDNGIEVTFECEGEEVLTKHHSA